MRNRSWITLATTIGALLCVVLWTSARAESVRDVISAAEARWVKLYNAKDAAGLAKLYTADALRLAPDASRVQGRMAIQAQLQKEFDDGLRNISFQETDSGYDASFVWLVGNFAVDYPGQQGKLATATGNYIVMYRKESDGVWRLVIDTWNEAPAK
jgi:ketosteroid isomerase-like protein